MGAPLCPLPGLLSQVGPEVLEFRWSAEELCLRTHFILMDVFPLRPQLALWSHVDTQPEGLGRPTGVTKNNFWTHSHVTCHSFMCAMSLIHV